MRHRQLIIRSLLLLVLLLGGPATLPPLCAQVTIQPVPVSSGIVSRPMLWNCVLVNSATTALQVRVQVVVTDRQSTQVLLSGTSTMLTLPTGATQLQYGTASPVQYSSGAMTGGAGDYLVAGSYQLCYYVLPVAEVVQPLAQDCGLFDVSPLLPPQLVWPADSSVLRYGPTQLSWIPPAPPFIFQNLSYQLLLTEVNPGQTGLDAVQQNVPLLSQSFIANNFLAVSGTQSLWQPGKTYAWQVVATDGGGGGSAYTAKSETWTFRMDTVLQAADSVSEEPFVVLQRAEVSQPVVTLRERRLRVQFHSFANDHLGSFEISEGGAVKKRFAQWIRAGENHYELPLGRWCEAGRVYRLVVRDERGSGHTALFQRSAD